MKLLSLAVLGLFLTLHAAAEDVDPHAEVQGTEAGRPVDLGASEEAAVNLDDPEALAEMIRELGVLDLTGRYGGPYGPLTIADP